MYFFRDDADAIEPVPQMLNVYRYGINQIITALQPLIKKGLSSVLLFGVIKNLKKDEFGANADSLKNPVIQALNVLKNEFPNLLIACDVSISNGFIYYHFFL